ncbi:DUF2207 domain-containing protein [Propionibacteriaceae bacterium Y2011]
MVDSVAKRPLVRLLLIGAVLGLLAPATSLVPASSARADTDDWSITRYQMVATLQPDGTMRVDLDFTFDFADEPGHGPYLTFVTRQEIADDPDHYRVLEYSDITASSPSGAPADLRTESGSDGLEVRVGDEDVEVEGPQDYRISYTVAGIPTSDVGPNGEDEIYWNAIGTGWEVEIRDVRIELNTGAEVLQAACYVGGSGSDISCQPEQAQADGEVAVFTQVGLQPGEGMTIVTAHPAGAFGGVQPILTHRVTPANFLGYATPATIGAGVLGLGGVGGVIWLARRRGRDQAYQGVTPGLAPNDPDARGLDAAGSDAAGPDAAGPDVGPAAKTAVAVRFTPPDDVRPGAAGTLLDEVAHPADVSATIVDLAVRGHLRIEDLGPDELGTGTDDPRWRLHRTPDAVLDDRELLEFEKDILHGVFADDQDSVRLDEIGTELAAAMGKTQSSLYDRVVELGWFRDSPQRVRTRWALSGVGIIVLGLALLLLLGLTVGVGILGIGVALVGVAVLIAAWFAPARTAAGTAVLAQVLGFREYLATAEGDQLKFEAENDIFSRYLPYAMAFGVADHWTKVFADAAAAGRPVPEPTWYATGYGSFWAANSLSSFSSFTTGSGVAGVAAQAAASSGGSGFSGGSVGGGVGGGGGGGW